MFVVGFDYFCNLKWFNFSIYMNTIQDLTEQLFHEGVEKGNQQAQQIVAEAESKKEALLEEARRQAAQIVAEAERKASELDKNTKAELKLFAGQASEALKSEVVNLLTDKVLAKTVEPAVTDPDFMKKLLLSFVGNWASQGELVIGTSDEKALTDYFKANAVDVLNQGLTIEQVNGLATDFTLKAADGSYKIQLGKSDFVEYFKEFLRPKLVEMLF